MYSQQAEMPSLGGWTVSVARCDRCGFAFNFRHARRWGICALRRGNMWTFRCPECGSKTNLILAPDGALPALPAYTDAPFLRFLVLALPVDTAAVAIIVLALYFEPYISWIVAQAVWLSAYAFGIGYTLFTLWRLRNRVGLRRIA